jgi:hypothetical protein
VNLDGGFHFVISFLVRIVMRTLSGGEGWLKRVVDGWRREKSVERSGEDMKKTA